MTRRYLNRYKNQEFDQDIEEAEDSNITEKLKKFQDNFEPTEETARTIAFDREVTVPREEKIKDEIKKTKFHFKVTGNYQDVLNSKLKERLAKIEKIMQAKKQFDIEIENLKDIGGYHDASCKSLLLSGLEVNDLKKMLQSELSDYNNIKSNLEYFQKKAHHLMKELEEKEKNIYKIKGEIAKKTISHTKRPQNSQNENQKFSTNNELLKFAKSVSKKLESKEVK